MKKIILVSILFLSLNCNAYDRTIAVLVDSEAVVSIDRTYDLMISDKEYCDLLYKAENSVIHKTDNMTRKIVYAAHYYDYQLNKLGLEKFIKWKKEKGLL